MEYIILAIWLYCVMFSCVGLFAVARTQRVKFTIPQPWKEIELNKDMISEARCLIDPKLTSLDDDTVRWYKWHSDKYYYREQYSGYTWHLPEQSASFQYKGRVSFIINIDNAISPSRKGGFESFALGTTRQAIKALCTDDIPQIKVKEWHHRARKNKNGGLVYGWSYS